MIKQNISMETLLFLNSTIANHKIAGEDNIKQKLSIAILAIIGSQIRLLKCNPYKKTGNR